MACYKKKNLYRFTPSAWQLTFCICEVKGIHCSSCPVEMLTRNLIMKLTKSFLERVQPQTTAAMLLLLKFYCPALYFANALLGAGINRNESDIE